MIIPTHPIKNATIIWKDGTGLVEVQELRCTPVASGKITVVLNDQDIWLALTPLSVTELFHVLYVLIIILIVIIMVIFMIVAMTPSQLTL